MNLNGLTQLQIEEEFNQKKVKQDISERVEAYALTIEEQEPMIEQLMIKYLDDINTLDVKEVVLVLLSMLGNHKAGITLGQLPNGDIKPLARGMKKIFPRDIPFGVFIKTFYKDRYIQETFKHKAGDFAMDLAVELDGIFFDIIKRIEMVEDGQFRTLTYIRTELLFDINTSLRAHYERFRLPLIERPHHWTTERKGGYHLNKSNCITNRGCNEQPQNVLDVLNRLQDQPYIHKQDEVAEFNFNVAKFTEDNWKTKGRADEKMAIDKAKAMALTTRETYEAIGDLPIYFEWKFDSRGRLYSTGYDINLQGNKAKKGALRPVLW